MSAVFGSYDGQLENTSSMSDVADVFRTHWYNINTELLTYCDVSLQAQCWPNVMKALGAWYPDRVRNTVFGMFGTCAFAGGIIGTAVAVSFYLLEKLCCFFLKN